MGLLWCTVRVKMFLHEWFCSTHTYKTSHTCTRRLFHFALKWQMCSGGCKRSWKWSVTVWVCINLKKIDFMFPQWDILKRTHCSHTHWDSLCFLIYVQMHWCFNIPTLNDQKKAEPVRRDKKTSIWLSQKTPAESFTTMRCIVVIKEALEYRLHRLICEMLFSLSLLNSLLPTHT